MLTLDIVVGAALTKAGDTTARNDKVRARIIIRFMIALVVLKVKSILSYLCFACIYGFAYLYVRNTINGLNNIVPPNCLWKNRILNQADTI